MTKVSALYIECSSDVAAYARDLLYSDPTAINLNYLSDNPLQLRVLASAMSKRFEGKTVLITGASSGIGRSTAFEFARSCPKNLKLVLTARRIDSLKQVASEINKEVGDGVRVLPVQLDVSKADEVRNFVGQLPDEFKEVDVLVNNA